MATDFSDRPKPPVLKRFANLDLDGDDGQPLVARAPRARPTRADSARRGAQSAPIVTAPSTGPTASPTRPGPQRSPQGIAARAPEPSPRFPNDPDLEAADLLARELTNNSRYVRTEMDPDSRRAQRAAELRGMRPPDPMPPPRAPRSSRRDPIETRLDIDPTRGMTSTSFVIGGAPSATGARSEGASSRGSRAAFEREALARAADALVRRVTEDLRPAGPADLYDFDLPEGMTPGVVTMEVDLRRSPRAPERPPRNTPRPPNVAPPEARSQGPAESGPRRTRAPGVFARGARTTPVELTPMAARQIMLMSWEAGVPGSPLRILTSRVPGLGRPELDFAFDENLEPDDLVFESQGVTIVVDPASFSWVSGRRITWHDVPGSEGFSLLP